MNKSKARFKMIYFSSLNKERKEAALLMEAAWVVKRLKDGTADAIAGLEVDLVNKFNVYAKLIKSKNNPNIKKDTVVLKNQIALGVMKQVFPVIADRMFPDDLDPMTVYESLGKYPDQPYRALIR